MPARGSRLRNRTRAREAALQVLYQLDLRGTEILGELDALLRHLLAPMETDPSVTRFARDLVTGCWDHRAELDQRIRQIAENWDLDRMAVVDRSVLRMAAFELLYVADVPPKVAINEAIDLAKRYSTADSGAFVNGILDKILMDRDKASVPSDSEGHEQP